MVFGALASLLPGLAAAGSSFIKNTAADILSGKGFGQSLKENAIKAAEQVIPGAGGLLEKGISAVGSMIKGREDNKKALRVSKFKTESYLNILKNILKNMQTTGAAASNEEEEERKDTVKSAYRGILAGGSLEAKKKAKKYLRQMREISPGFAS